MTEHAHPRFTCTHAGGKNCSTGAARKTIQANFAAQALINLSPQFVSRGVAANSTAGHTVGQWLMQARAGACMSGPRFRPCRHCARAETAPPGPPAFNRSKPQLWT